MLGLGLGVDKIRPVTAGGLLDLYPATAAYSLRALSSSTTNVVRVREDGSNTEQDFTAKEITDGTLASFCGANNGFVVTWYDQSGNTNDATQATAASQPKIVSSGNVILKGGNSAIDFDGSNDLLRLTSGAVNIDNVTTFTAFAADSNAQDATFLHYTIGNLLNYVAVGLGNLGTSATMGHRYIYNGSIYTSGVDFSTTNLSLVSTLSLNGTSTQLYLNGIAGDKTYQARSGGVFSDIGSGNTNEFNGKILEVIIYESDQSANRTAIETNINDYYSIYP